MNGQNKSYTEQLIVSQENILIGFVLFGFTGKSMFNRVLFYLSWYLIRH